MLNPKLYECERARSRWILDFGILLPRIPRDILGWAMGVTMVVKGKRGFGLIPGCVSLSGDASDP